MCPRATAPRTTADTTPEAAGMTKSCETNSFAFPWRQVPKCDCEKNLQAAQEQSCRIFLCRHMSCPGFSPASHAVQPSVPLRIRSLQEKRKPVVAANFLRRHFRNRLALPSAHRLDRGYKFGKHRGLGIDAGARTERAIILPGLHLRRRRGAAR